MAMSKKFHVPTGEIVFLRGNLNGGRVQIQRADGTREIVPGAELRKLERKNASKRRTVELIAATHPAIKRPVPLEQPPVPPRRPSVVHTREIGRGTQCVGCGRVIVRGVRAKAGWECGACAAGGV